MPPVLPGTALWMVLIAAALPLGNGKPVQRRLAIALAATCLALSLAQLSLRFFPGPVGIPMPNGFTSLSMGLLSAALLLRDHGARLKWDPSGSCALLAMVAPYFALMGYALHLVALYRPSHANELALPTALVLIMLSLAMLASRPERGLMALWYKAGPGGALLRRQVPAVLLVPMLLGIVAIAGERVHLFPQTLALGFLLVLMGLAGVGHTWLTSRALDDLEEAREEAIRDLQGSEAMFRGLMEGASDAILVIDEQGRIAFKNRQSAILFGYEPSELLGLPIDRLVPARYRGSHGSRIASFMRSPEARTLESVPDLCAARRDGSEFPAEISLSPVETVEGSFVMVLVRDLTDRHKAAEAMAHARALERADAMKDEFLNIVSHELRTPISVLSGSISLLEYEVDGPLSPCQRTDVARLRESTDHLLMLVNDLLDISMINAGKLTILPKPLSVGELIAGAIDIVQPIATERRVDLRTDLSIERPVIRADGQRIRQVILNLVTNALKYSPEGSIVAIRVRADETGLRCEIEDQGPGVPVEEQGRIFEKFTRVHADAAVDGAGLGLYICQALVAAHDGAIGVESDGMTGSTFWFTLPQTR